MKLHLPVALAAVICAGMAYAAEHVNIDQATIEKTFNADNNPNGASVYGVAQNEHASNLNNTHITIEDGATINSVQGGVQVSGRDYKNWDVLTDDTLDGGVVIDVKGGTITGTIYGGSTLPQALPDSELPNTGSGTNYTAKMQESVEILGDKLNAGSITINVSGGVIGTTGSSDEAIMGGGGRYCGTESTGGIEVNISGGTINNKVYAGTNGGSTGYTKLNISGGTINSDVYGAGRKDYGVVLGNTAVNISGGTINGNVYAAGDADTVKGDAVVTITGGEIGGNVYGGGTNGSTVEGDRVLNVGTSETAYNGSLSVADFEKINIDNGEVTITSLDVAAEGTVINVADEASLELTLTEVVAGSAAAGLVFEGNGGVTLNTEALTYTVVLSDAAIAQGGEQSFTLVEGNFSLIASMYDSTATVNFVMEDGTAVAVENLVLETQLLSDVNLNEGGITINPDGSISMGTASGTSAIVAKATLAPEPTTATLSLLALAALAARRRRR